MDAQIALIDNLIFKLLYADLMASIGFILAALREGR